MKLELSEFIEEKISIDTELFLARLKNQTSTRFQVFPDKLLTGEIIGNKFDFKINPPSLWVDPFKSKAQGQIIHTNGLNKYQFKISPSLSMILFLGGFVIL